MLIVERLFDAPRLGEIENGRSNNLNLIRFCLASLVILSHSYVSLGLYAWEPLHRALGYLELGSLAVFGFFFVSGYLILKSALRWKSPEAFLEARALRIFPGVFATVLLCVFVAGPFLTTASLHNYFGSRLTWRYLSELSLYKTQHLLPGVCEHNTLPYLNGVLWTLPGEWTMYVVTLLACLPLMRRRSAPYGKRTWWIVGIAVVLTAQMWPLAWPQQVSWMGYFALGSLVYVVRQQVKLSVPLALALIVGDVILFRMSHRAGMLCLPLALCYAILTLAFHPAVQVRFFHRFGDYSYGLYIYGQPIQQALLHHFQHPLQFFVACYPLVLGAAILSWHLIENPCLRLKGRLGKGLKPAELVPRF